MKVKHLNCSLLGIYQEIFSDVSVDDLGPITGLLRGIPQSLLQGIRHDKHSSLGSIHWGIPCVVWCQEKGTGVVLGQIRGRREGMGSHTDRRLDKVSRLSNHFYYNI